LIKTTMQSLMSQFHQKVMTSQVSHLNQLSQLMKKMQERKTLRKMTKVLGSMTQIPNSSSTDLLVRKLISMNLRKRLFQ